MRDDIAQADYMKWRPAKGGKYIVIGNPPFGKYGNTATAFIARSALFADVCAFILPRSSVYDRMKGGVMKRQMFGYKLSALYEIGDNPFHTPDGKLADIRGCFFAIYGKQMCATVRAAPLPTCHSFADIFSFSSATPKRKINAADVYLPNAVLSGASQARKLRAYTDFAALPSTKGYGIVIKRDRDKLLPHIMAFDWAANCCVATNRTQGLNKGIIIDAITSGGFIDECLLSPSSAAGEGGLTAHQYVDIFSIRNYPTRRIATEKIGRCDIYLPEALYPCAADKMRAYNDFADLPYPQGYGIVIKRDRAALLPHLTAYDWRAAAGKNANGCLSINTGIIRAAVIAGGFADNALV